MQRGGSHKLAWSGLSINNNNYHHFVSPDHVVYLLHACVEVYLFDSQAGRGNTRVGLNCRAFRTRYELYLRLCVSKPKTFSVLIGSLDLHNSARKPNLIVYQICRLCLVPSVLKP